MSNDRSKRRAAARKAELPAVRDGVKNRSVRFINRRKEDAKRACRKPFRKDT